jgi:SAM-dependent methyltransferase
MNQDRIWDHFQSAGIDSFRNSDPRQRFLVTRLRPGSRVLNVGIGAGVLEALALDRRVDIHALDPSEAAVAGLRERLGLGGKVALGRVEDVPFGAAGFDTVVMSEVLEHLDDAALAAALGEVRRLLVPGGRLLLTVPHDEHLPDGEVICPGCGTQFHRWGHVRSFNRARLRETLERHGFRVGTMSLEAFPDWQRAGLANLLKSAARFVMGKLGMAIAQPCIYAEATVREQ